MPFQGGSDGFESVGNDEINRAFTTALSWMIKVFTPRVERRCDAEYGLGGTPNLP